ncbi:hypothetical protein Pint_01540 [Pistacia integerrima]|uniref:Uncharacterized protein n=1 Tax=Pistacia integerrima TaxID=434235 RepID=A0ACC0ZK15_9ROSI|nr:hypothetical protein Pint_01540 [Pistacia integerrima]
MDSFPHLHPLTSLQIGYVKSHLSKAFLYFAPVSHKFLILVDNQSWRKNKQSRSAFIRELMITKYRLSPFINHRTLHKSPNLGYRSPSHESKNLYKWFPIVNMARLREKVPFSAMNLYEALHGLIVFEVAWSDVRGINYFNKLQDDTSFALEVKALRKWEFNGIDQALACITSWFTGTESETQTLQNNLVLLHNKVPSLCSHEITVAAKELLFNDASQAELFSEDVFFDVRECPIDTNDILSRDCQVAGTHGNREQNVEMNSSIESMEYKDTFLLFTFNDTDLPCKLRQIITPDLKLLALLEAGLPSWVIFLQSYPLFCKVYSPWMPPLFRTFYILISLITVVIGFYDLYKNIPLLKATASHLCGPLFKWIEEWDGISRIRYLGTMLFLHNLEKAIKWFLTMMRMVTLSVSLLMKPLTYPLGEIIEFVKPMWIIFAEMGEQFYITTWVWIGPFFSMISDFVEVLFSPFELLYSCLASLARGCLVLANHVVSLFCSIYTVFVIAFKNIASSMNDVTLLSKVKSNSSQISLWGSLWNDLFSQVFRSLRNIFNGLVAFWTSCTQYRHRTKFLNDTIVADVGN